MKRPVAVILPPTQDYTHCFVQLLIAEGTDTKLTCMLSTVASGEEEPLRGLIACLYEDSDGDKMVQVGARLWP
jgi:hypothetical protein